VNVPMSRLKTRYGTGDRGKRGVVKLKVHPTQRKPVTGPAGLELNLRTGLGGRKRQEKKTPRDRKNDSGGELATQKLGAWKRKEVKGRKRHKESKRYGKSNLLTRGAVTLVPRKKSSQKKKKNEEEDDKGGQKG